MKILILSLLMVGVFSACSKNNTPPQEELISSLLGTYTGFYNTEGTLKSALHDSSATAEITGAGEGQIEVWCYGHDLDTTIILDIYEDNDTVMVCMTGDAFTQEYGHMKGHQMGHGMHSTTGTEWMHHLEDEHSSGDRHYGMFDTTNHTFEYAFKMMVNDTVYYTKFHGTKNQ